MLLNNLFTGLSTVAFVCEIYARFRSVFWGLPFEDEVIVFRKKSISFVVVDTLDNLVKGGRIGKGRAMLGSLLSIKPIASLAGGEYTPVAKARSYKQVITYLMNEFTKDSAAKRVKAVGIAQADGYQMATPLKEAIEATGFKDVKLSFTTPVISTHTGPGAIGFMYLFASFSKSCLDVSTNN